MEILVSIIGSVAGNIAESALQPIRRQFGYLISYETNIKSLTEEVQRLDDQITGVQQLVDAEGRNLREPMPVVQSWLQQARDTSEEIHRFVCTEVARVSKGCCMNGWCPDLRSRYSVSRRASKKTSVVIQLLQNGSFPADQIACPARPPRFVSTLTMTTRAFQDFESRVVIMDKVMEALKDDSVNMIRICGAGGVGKTTMASKIVNKVKEEKLFDEVAMAVVSQTPDSKKIRDAIADQLGLKLDQQSEEGRAAQLHARIVKINKFLLVLDDVWDELQCADIGLPSGSEGAQFAYKILFTSRREDVFLTSGIMRSPTNFIVPTLSEEEAWCLFKESAGSCCEAPIILPMAKKIVNECGGLPIAIVTVGNSIGVAGSNEREWSDALRELKRGRHGNRAHSCIKLSYNYLKCEELQGFFLLCCLFPEDADIPVETLLRYGMGLGLLTKDHYSLEDARNRVHALVGKLSRLFLLLESKRPEHVKMHDVVRDVGISLASEDQENGLMNTCKYYESDEVLGTHASRFDPTNLKLLFLSKLQRGIPLNFFEGMKRLNVLALSKEIEFFASRPKFPPLELHGLVNIQTLCLEYYNFENLDLSALGSLRSLEILSFYGWFGLRLPSNLGLLTRLRLLDCRSSRQSYLEISYGVLSGLKQLEELYLGNNTVNWEVEEEGKEVVNARLAELKCLSNLTTLTITLPEAQLIDPKDLHFEKLVRFQIGIGRENNWLDEKYSFRNSLAISLQVEERMDHHMESLIHSLLKRTEVLHLEGKHLKNLYDMVRRESLAQLKGLTLTSFRLHSSIGLEYVVDAAFTCLESLHLSSLDCLKWICHVQGQPPLMIPSFSNLRSLKVTSCNKLKYVLPLSVARALLQLKSLEVHFCDMVEEVFSMESSWEGEGAAAGTITIKLPQLSNLELGYLPNLTALCKSMVVFEIPQLKTLELRCLPELKSLDTTLLPSYKVLPTHWIQHLQNLQVLKVESCESIEELFDLEQANNSEFGQLGNAGNTILPRLEEVHLEYLPGLKHVWKNGAHACQGFQNLKILEVSNCDSMEYIVGEGEEDDMEGATTIVNILFPQLFKLRLSELQNLVSFFRGNKCTLEWASMRELILEDCPNMKTFSSRVADHTDIISDDHFFNEDVRLVKLNTVEIKNMDCGTIWHCKTEATIREMKISSCPSLKNVLASSYDGIKMVEDLEVSECESLDVVFQFHYEQGIDADLLHSGLKQLTLNDLPELTHICNTGPRDHHLSRVIIEAALTRDLTYLNLDNCPSLQHVFSLSSTARSVLFPELEGLHIQNCSMMEEVFAKEETDDEASTSVARNVSIVLFPKLNHLTLEDNANVKSIFKGIDAYKATEGSLELMDIKGCPKLGPSSSYFSLLNSAELWLADIAFEKQKVSVSSTKGSPSQLFMLIDGVDNLMDLLILDRKSLPRYFPSINSMKLANLSNFPNAAWLQFLQSLPMLETLHISSCGSVEVIFGLDQGLNVNQLPLFTKLRLTNMEKLTSIWMKGIPGLFQRFHNLRELYVGQCHSLRNLLSPSMAKHLVNLIIFAVGNCDSVNEICGTECKAIKEIGVQEDEGEEISTETIEFPRVKYLVLENLPNLTSFCATDQGYTINWPSLTRFVVTGCPRFKTFALAVPSTPMLKEVETESKKYPLIEDLNDTIQLIFKEKGSEVGILGAVTQEQNEVNAEHENISI